MKNYDYKTLFRKKKISEKEKKKQQRKTNSEIKKQWKKNNEIFSFCNFFYCKFGETVKIKL